MRSTFGIFRKAQLRWQGLAAGFEPQLLHARTGATTGNLTTIKGSMYLQAYRVDTRALTALLKHDVGNMYVLRWYLEPFGDREELDQKVQGNAKVVPFVVYARNPKQLKS